MSVSVTVGVINNVHGRFLKKYKEIKSKKLK